MGYMGDYDYVPRAGSGATGPFFTHLIAPYAGIPLATPIAFDTKTTIKVFQCPSATTFMYPANQNLAGKGGLNYLTNGYITNAGADTTGNPAGYGFKAGRVKRPFEMLMLFDGTNPGAAGATTAMDWHHNRIAYRHPQGFSTETLPSFMYIPSKIGVNVLWMDGHVGNWAGTLTYDSVVNASYANMMIKKWRPAYQ